MSKVHTSMSKKLTLTVLEVTSMVLSKLEEDVKTKDVPKDLPLPQLINTINGIVLTYRFGGTKKKARRFVHIRKVACANLTNLIHAEMANMAKMQGQLRSIMQSPDRQAETRQFVTESFEAMIATANQKLDDKVESHLAQADQRMAMLDMGISQADSILEAAGVQRPTTDIQASMAASKDQMVSKAAEMKERKDVMVQTMSELVKNHLLSKMEPLAGRVQQALDQLFVVLTLANHKYNFEKQGDQLRQEVLEMVERMYETAAKGISDEVEKVTDLLSAVMQRKIDGEDPDTDDEEEE